MEGVLTRSLRKISSAKRKRGRTPKKPTASTDNLPNVVDRSAKEPQPIPLGRCGQDCHSTPDGKATDGEVPDPHTRRESAECWGLDSSDTDFNLVDLDLASLERKHLSREVVHRNEELSDNELFNDSDDMFGVWSCVDDECDNGLTEACSIQQVDNDVFCETDVKQTFISIQDIGCENKVARQGSPDIWGGHDVKGVSACPTEHGDASCGVRTYVDIATVGEGCIDGSSTPKGSPVLKCGPTTAIPSVSAGICGRLKRTLQQNARCSTPKNDRVKRLQDDRVASALTASKVAAHDITGPFYGLPSKVQQLFEKHRGITTLYEWQEECLSLPGVRARRNLIYSLPTSGGKTLVAEILMLREILCWKRDVLFILPFVSIVQEKVRGLSEFALELNFLVEEYAGAKGQMPPRRRKKNCIYIATIEKANSLINSLIEDGRIDSIGLLVVDELHMLGESGSRGAVLEMSLTKVMHASADTLVIGMSATLSNIADLQTFLNADVYSNDFRPVALQEFVKINDNVYQMAPGAGAVEERFVHSRVCVFQYDRAKTKLDPDHVAALVLEVAPQYSCLVFCASKKNCENVAQLICRFMPRAQKNIKQKERHLLLKALKHAGNGNLCPVLSKTVACGVAYHHGGLMTDERKLLEEAYSGAILCVLTCTSTLAAGVNLPAKRVILRSPYVGMSFLSRTQYRQMAGRAGRAGIDSSGESILIVQGKDKAKLLQLLDGPVERCLSNLLYEGGKGLRQLLLTTIGLKLTTSIQSAQHFLRRTLCHVQSAELGVDLVSLMSTELLTLQDGGLVKMTAGELEVTTLGRATMKGSVDIDRAGQLYSDLRTARQSLVVSNHLHLLYVVTPYDLVSQVKPSWTTYFNQMNSLDEEELKAATLIGVSVGYIAKKASGMRTRKLQNVNEDVVDRFYMTLMLYGLWRRQSVWDVSAKFQLPRGFIQQLLSSSASFASCVMHFCQELDEFWAFHDLLPTFVKRLSYCVSMELIPLVEIPAVTIGRARQLYRAGYKNLQQVAFAESPSLVRAIEFLSHKAAKQIIASAKLLLTEKVETLRDEADGMTTVPVDMPTEAVVMTTETGNSQGH